MDGLRGSFGSLQRKAQLHASPAMPGACMVPGPGGGAGIAKRGSRNAPPPIFKRGKRQKVANFGGQSDMLEAEIRVRRLLHGRQLAAAADLFLKSGEDAQPCVVDLLLACIQAGDLTTAANVAHTSQKSALLSQADVINCLLRLPQNVCPKTGEAITDALASNVSWGSQQKEQHFRHTTRQIVSGFLKAAEAAILAVKQNEGHWTSVRICKGQQPGKICCDLDLQGGELSQLGLLPGASLVLSVDSSIGNAFCECEVLSEKPLTLKALDFEHDLVEEMTAGVLSTFRVAKLATRSEYSRDLCAVSSVDEGSGSGPSLEELKQKCLDKLAPSLESSSNSHSAVLDLEPSLQSIILEASVQGQKCTDSSDEECDRPGPHDFKVPPLKRHDGVSSSAIGLPSVVSAVPPVASRDSPSPFFSAAMSDVSSLGLIARTPKARKRSIKADGIAGLGGYGSSSSSEEADAEGEEDEESS